VKVAFCRNRPGRGGFQWQQLLEILPRASQEPRFKEHAAPVLREIEGLSTGETARVRNSLSCAVAHPVTHENGQLSGRRTALCFHSLHHPKPRPARLSQNRASRRDAKKVAGGEPRSGAAPGHDKTCMSPGGATENDWKAETSVAPPGLCQLCLPTGGLRPRLQSAAAPRLSWQ
jgi:hypothetical protein